jgi:2-amino-4-hydroxy-6-hydroxymethyldihydropteridine diphosphokinase/dihydropteroate synthase
MIYLGLGSNLGDRRQNLESALNEIKFRLKPSSFRVSPIYETPALLPPNADSHWNQPFLNLAVELDSTASIQELFELTQFIEIQAGRTSSPRWAPRVLDIDILLYGNAQLQHQGLIIPHKEIKKRAFVLDPLKDLNPSMCLPGETESLLNLARRQPQHAPVWMTIANLTPDSFSDSEPVRSEGDQDQRFQRLVENNIGIIDIGGESTRPGATPLTPEQEWNRVGPALRHLREKFKGRSLRPLLSLDTYHFESALRAIELGVDIVNDVSGLADLRFVDLIKSSHCSYVLMHSLSVPANPNQVLPPSLDVMAELESWFRKKIQLLVSQGIKKDQIILDPGLGFGKSPLQSQIILQNVERLFSLNHRILIGHSRKSYMKSYAPRVPDERDPESLGASLALIDKGIDILRVHNPWLHMRAFQGWNHVRSPR